ncbi:MAG: S41 family peptidase, partial [Planctomycetales bacterium]|nr:S41 family peptidase [Planctomycetales bacterium]
VALACARIALREGVGDIAPLVRLVKEGGAHAPWAAFVLGQLGGDEGREALEGIFEDPASARPVRLAAARGLVAVRPVNAPARAALREAASADDPLGRQAALALAEADDVASVASVLKAIAGEPTVEGATARAHLALAPLKDRLASGGPLLRDLVVEAMTTVESWYPHELAPSQAEGATAKERVDRAFLRDAAARGMVASLDQFSGYMILREYTRNQERMAGSYGGIGAYVRLRPYRGDAPGGKRREVLSITQPIYRRSDGELAPAYAAGIRSGDQIVRALVPERPAPVELVGKPLEECVDLLKGKEGTQVRVWVRRRGGSEPIEIPPLTRAMITINTAPHEMLPGGLGYCHLIRFDNKSGDDLEAALKDLKRMGARALLLDLRDNLGGSLDEVVACASLFVPEGSLITTTKGRHAGWKEREYRTTRKPLWDAPVVVLTTNDSASGAELLSGVLRDHQRATIIGLVVPEHHNGDGSTFGKGSGQTFLPLQKSRDEKGLFTRFVRITVFKYFLPSGDTVHGKGLLPHLAVSGDTDDWPEWRIEEQDRLRDFEAVEPFVDRLLGSVERGKLEALARYDDHDTSAYPGLDVLGKALGTRLDREGLRFLVRESLRTRLQDIRGQEFLQNFQEEIQVQRGILEALAKVGARAADVAEYRHFADRKFVEKVPAKPAAAQPR